MKNLYEFLESKYEGFYDKQNVSFDQFIRCFLDNTFGINSLHEAFIGEGDEDFLGEFEMDFEINHKNKEIKLLFI